MAEPWMKCSACRSEIPFGAKHYVCSVSTCSKGKIKLVFDSVACWDSHVAEARHREAWAVDAVAPSRDAWAKEQEAHEAVATVPAKPSSIAAAVTGEPRARIVIAGDPALQTVADKDQLIVISKMKKYIKDRSGMNCSDAVADQLSEHVRMVCDDAIRAAGRDERKTVLDRDVPKPRR
ncbi:MAG TPA: hypothetical protein VGM88_24780 [Kofleriaceae bacterium]|jgi:hypothetical protein